MSKRKRSNNIISSTVMLIIFYIVLFIVVGLLLSCEKEHEPEFVNVKQRYSIEGTYEGISVLDCPGFGYYKERKNIVEITAYDAERISVSSMRTNAKANVNQNRYNYVEFFWIGTSDCGRDMFVTYQGSGQIVGDSLIENGIAQVNGYPATWKTRSIKTK